MQTEKFFIFVITHPDKRNPITFRIPEAMTEESAKEAINELHPSSDGYIVKETHPFETEIKMIQQYNTIALRAKQMYFNPNATTM